MAVTPNLKTQVEAVVGQALSQSEFELIKIIQDIASSTVTGGGSVTSRNLLIGAPNRCRTESLIDVAGFARTGPDGKSKILLNKFLCPPDRIFAGPVNVVATPVSATPCYLTLIHTVLAGGADVQIDVSTWNPDGTAAPGVVFDWRCRAVLPIILT